MENAHTESVTLEPTLDFQRVDKMLSTLYPSFSRTYFQYLLESGAILCNGRPLKKKDIPTPGDTLEIEFLYSPEITATPQNLPLEILYEDAHLVVINKAAGMTVHPAPGSPDSTVVNALMYKYKELAVFGDSLRPGIVHRLDKDTSGVLVVAKNRQTHAALADAFAERRVKKTYLAITCGSPKEGLCEAPIGRHPKERKLMTVSDNGKHAATIFTPIEKRADALTLLELNLLTGRTHQIRVHAKYLGTPILGDAVYGLSKWNERYGITSQLLHAWKIAFTHPITQEMLTFEAKVPESFAKLFPNLIFVENYLNIM